MSLFRKISLPLAITLGLGGIVASGVVSYHQGYDNGFRGGQQSEDYLYRVGSKMPAITTSREGARHPEEYDLVLAGVSYAQKVIPHIIGVTESPKGFGFIDTEVVDEKYVPRDVAPCRAPALSPYLPFDEIRVLSVSPEYWAANHASPELYSQWQKGTLQVTRYKLKGGKLVEVKEQR